MPRWIEGTQHRQGIVIACLTTVLVLPAFAWVFPEHRDIAVLAVQKLSAEQHVLLQHLWSEARAGHESRLCEQAADSGHGTEPTCIDYAAWTAIAGDHSCSADNMLNTVLNAPWIIPVVRVGVQLKIKLGNAKRRDQRVNAVRDSDLALERTDPEYVTRAASNNAHFLLARPTVSIRPEDYAHLALGPDAELNALGTYVWYHLRALQQASRVARTSIPYNMRGDGIRAALADEAFALHFLQDSFAAGHVTGNWGKTPIRKGTRDYYNEYGVPLVTWSGEPFVAEGDAYMRPEDAERTAIAARDSLAQLLDAFAGKLDINPGDDTKPIGPDKFDVCHESHFSSSVGTRADIITVAPILRQTPVPALKAGIGEYPRFRSELGPFFGLSAAFRGGAMTRGFAATQTGAVATVGLEVSARFGYGMEGVLNE